MKKFKFSMEKILNLREFEQKQAEIELGKANAKVSQIQNLLNEIAKNKILATTENDEPTSDLLAKSQSQIYINFLEQKKEEYLKQLVEAQMVAEQKREIVKQAMQKVKVLEQLKERKRLEWKKEIEKEEELSNEDISTTLFAYKTEP